MKGAVVRATVLQQQHPLRKREICSCCHWVKIGFKSLSVLLTS